MSPDLSAHVEIDEDICVKCGEKVRDIYPVECRDGCCEQPWCLDCAFYAGFPIF